MARAVIAAVLVLSTAVGCARVSDSRLNPFNWFGGSTESTGLAPDGGFAEIAPDRRNLVDQVTQLRVERTPGGAVIRATGLPPRAGFL